MATTIAPDGENTSQRKQQHDDCLLHIFLLVISLLAQRSISRQDGFQCYDLKANKDDCVKAQNGIVYLEPSKTLGTESRLETTASVGSCTIKIHRRRPQNIAAKADVDDALNSIFKCSGSSGYTIVYSLNNSDIQVSVMPSNY
ncbi:hypothetical protein PSTT_11865 [Puccinia striiformis]|uniref:Uncharacterized protein n=1 Tax=Puccinia striiformis TaxID=27350 RepID=A0A2S4UYF4_9BASI|nr:hypothetical protein PSTT_11865 [Puccinia striiformis]